MSVLWLDSLLLLGALLLCELLLDAVLLDVLLLGVLLLLATSGVQLPLSLGSGAGIYY